VSTTEDDDDATHSELPPSTVDGFRERLRTESQKKRELRSELRSVQSQLEQVKQAAAKAAATETQLAALQSRYETERASWDTERAVFAVGITDPEAIDLARHLHGRLPEAGRPPLADWLKAAKAAPDTAPLGLRPYLQPAAAAQPAANTTPAAKQQPAAGASATTTTTTTGAASAPSPEHMRAVYTRALQTGDWSEWAQLRGKKSTAA
jgi:hypothetical protein